MNKILDHLASIYKENWVDRVEVKEVIIITCKSTVTNNDIKKVNTLCEEIEKGGKKVHFIIKGTNAS